MLRSSKLTLNRDISGKYIPGKEFEAEPRFGKEEFLDQFSLMKRGFLDRTVFGAVNNIIDRNKFTDLKTEFYNAEVDPQVPEFILKYHPQIVNGSRSRSETKYRIDKFLQRQKDKEEDLFNITSVVSEIFLDPVALLSMSAPVRALVFGAKSKQFGRIIGGVQAEEAVKQIGDTERPFTDAVVVASTGFVLNRLNKRFSKYNTDDDFVDLSKYDEATKSEIPPSAANPNTTAKKNPVSYTRGKTPTKETVDRIFQKILQEQTDITVHTLNGLGRVKKIFSTNRSVATREYLGDPIYNAVKFDRKTGKMYVDVQFIKQQFTRKAWTRKHPFFNEPQKKDLFKSFEEWLEFSIRRSIVARKTLPRQMQPKALKNEINRRAFKDLEEAKTVDKTGSTMIDDIDINNARDINETTFRNRFEEALTDSDYEKLPSVLGLEKSGLSPIDKVLGSVNNVAKEFVLNLTKSDLFHNLQKKVAMVDSAEQIQNTIFLPRLFHSIKNVQDNYVLYIKEATGKEIKYGKQFQQMISKTKKAKPGEETVLSYDDFNTEIYKAIIKKGDTLQTGVTAKYINKTAQDISEKYFKVYAKDLERTKVYMAQYVKRDEYLRSIENRLKSNKSDNLVFKDPDTKESWRLSEVRAAIKKNMEDLEKSRIRENYVPQLWVRTSIENNFKGFSAILKPLLERQKYNPEVIEEILQSYKQYNPFKSYDEIAQSTVPGMFYKLKNNPTSKFLKQRSINLDEEALEEMIAGGFLETNLETLMSFYYRSVSPDIVLSYKYGDPGGYGWFYDAIPDKYAPGLLQVRDKFEKLIMKAKGKEQEALIKEKNEVMKRLENLRDMRKGIFGVPENPHSFWQTGLRVSKLVNTLSQLTGASQLADIGRIVTIGGLTRNFGRLYEMFSKNMMTAFRAGREQGQYAGQIYDLVLQFSRSQILAGHDLFQGSLRGFEGKLQKLSAINFQYIQPMNPWTYISKTMASTHGGSDLIEKIAKVARGKIQGNDLMFLRQKGIDVADAKKIYKQYQKHGLGPGAKKWEFDKISMANSDLWDDADLTFRFNNALNQYIDELIITPSDGSAPLIANTPLGSMFFQYKKFGIDMTQKVLLKGLQTKDSKLIQDIAALTAMGMIVDAARTPAYDRDYGKKSLRAKLIDGAERGGVFGIFGDINRILESVSNNQLGIRPMFGDKRFYGTSFKSKFGSVFGPTGSTIGGVAEVLYDWGRGRHTHHTARRIRKLVPLNNIWYLDNIFDGMEKVIS